MIDQKADLSRRFCHQYARWSKVHFPNCPHDVVTVEYNDTVSMCAFRIGFFAPILAGKNLCHELFELALGQALSPLATAHRLPTAKLVLSTTLHKVDVALKQLPFGHQRIAAEKELLNAVWKFVFRHSGESWCRFLCQNILLKKTRT